MVPHAILIIATLGTIVWGWATPTEAAAMGVVGAAFLAVIYGQFMVLQLIGLCIIFPEIARWFPRYLFGK